MMKNRIERMEAKIERLEERNDRALDVISVYAGDTEKFIEIMIEDIGMSAYEVMDRLKKGMFYGERFVELVKYTLKVIDYDEETAELEARQLVASMLTTEAMEMYNSPDYATVNVADWLWCRWFECGFGVNFFCTYAESQMDVYGDNIAYDAEGNLATNGEAELCDYMGMLLGGMGIFDNCVMEAINQSVINHLHWLSATLHSEKGGE